MVERTTVAVKVSQETKDEWEEYAEENPEVENLSQLIRFSVRREMQGSHDTENATESPQMEKVGENMSQLLEGFGDVEDRLAGLESQVSAVEREVQAEGPGYDLQQAVFQHLPSAKEAPDNAEYCEWAATPEDLAEKVAGNVKDVKAALDTLTETTAQVQGVVGEPGSFYYKRE